MKSLFCIFVALGFSSQVSCDIRSKTKLVQKLMKNYNNDIIPEEKDGSAIVLSHGIALYRIKSFDNNVLTLEGHERLEWRDSRLTWNRTRHGDSLRFNSKSLWQPDMLLYNGAGMTHQADKADVPMMVTSDGTVRWFVPQTFRPYCKYNLDRTTKTNICKLHFGSWTYSGQELDLNPISSTIDLSMLDDEFKSFWELDYSNVTKKDFHYTCCVEAYPKIIYTLAIKRVV